MRRIVLVLHDIRSVHNVGSLFRTADACGVEHVYLTGYTPGPKDRFSRVRSDFAKVALGAHETVHYTHNKDVESVLTNLSKEGWHVLALEQDERATPYTNPIREKNVALVLGNETEGLSSHVLSRCAEVRDIPMHGLKESLNVSVAGGVMLLRVRDFV